MADILIERERKEREKKTGDISIHKNIILLLFTAYQATRPTLSFMREKKKENVSMNELCCVCSRKKKKEEQKTSMHHVRKRWRAWCMHWQKAKTNGWMKLANEGVRFFFLSFSRFGSPSREKERERERERENSVVLFFVTRVGRLC